MEFDLTVAYKKGAKNTIADAISRLPTYGEAKLALDTEVPCYFISHYEQEDSQEPPTDVGGEGVAVFTAEASPELEEAEEVSSLALKVHPVCAHTIEVEDFFDERFDEVDCEDNTDAATANRQNISGISDIPDGPEPSRTFSRMRKSRSVHYAFDNIVAYDLTGTEPVYKIRWTSRPS